MGTRTAADVESSGATLMCRCHEHRGNRHDKVRDNIAKAHCLYKCEDRRNRLPYAVGDTDCPADDLPPITLSLRCCFVYRYRARIGKLLAMMKGHVNGTTTATTKMSGSWLIK